MRIILKLYNFIITERISLEPGVRQLSPLLYIFMYYALRFWPI